VGDGFRGFRFPASPPIGPEEYDHPMDSSKDVYSHGHHESVLRSHKWRTVTNSAEYLRKHLVNGSSVLDVGCGPGNLTSGIAELVQPGSVIGVDIACDVIEMAKAEFTSSSISFEVADVYSLNFPDEVFDVVHAHQVLQHLGNPIAALHEMKRVVKTGGLVAVRDSDYGDMAWSPDDALLGRWLDLYQQIARRNGAEPNAGRYLGDWVRSVGFDEVHVSISEWNFVSDEDRNWWGNLWADRVIQSQFAVQGKEYGLTTSTELEEISMAFRRWAENPTGSFVVKHGEVVARK
jgi:ubiquinone/menaquinone biosynthesis C-methylase UbiE